MRTIGIVMMGFNSLQTGKRIASVFDDGGAWQVRHDGFNSLQTGKRIASLIAKLAPFHNYKGVSIPFKRESVSQVTNSGRETTKIVKVSIPFKRESVSQD